MTGYSVFSNSSIILNGLRASIGVATQQVSNNKRNIWSCSLSVHVCLALIVPRLSPRPDVKIFIGVRGEPGNEAIVCLLVCTDLVCHLNLDQDFQVATVEEFTTLGKDG